MSLLLSCSQNGSTGLNPMSFTDPHGNVLLERLRYQRDTGRFCDVYLVVKDRRFSAHRNILAACSPYFDSIFKNSKVVKEQVTVNCQNPAVFELLLNYMYSGSVVIDRSSVMDLLKFANNFLVTKVKNYCAEYLVRHMDAKNCITVKELALKYNLPALRDSAVNYFVMNINNCLVENSDILEYALSQVNGLFPDSRNISTVSPDVHFKFIVRWASHNPAERVPYFKELLQCCQFTMVPTTTIENLLDSSPFFANSMRARFILLQMMYEHSMPLGKYEAQYRSLIDQFEERIYYNNPQMVYNGNENQLSESLQCKEQVFGVEGTSNVRGERSNLLPNTLEPSTADQRLGSDNQSGGLRPSLKLKIQLNSGNLTSKRNRFFGKNNTSERHKLYRKSVTAANQMLARRRGRPPKNREPLTHLDPQFGDEALFLRESEFLGDAAIEEAEQGCFEEADEVDPLLLQDELHCGENQVTMGGQIGLNTFKCNYCEYRNVQEASVRSHINRVHARNLIYICGVCSFQCRWNKEYYSHMATHFQGLPFQCDHCTFVNDQIHVFLAHRLSHNEERPLKCFTCDYKSRSRANMIIHLNDHTPEKQYHCSECGRCFATQEEVNEHSTTHTESRPYQCSQCKFATKYQSHYISHRRVHTGDVYHCHYDACTYYSPKKSQLAAHLRTHLAVRSHQCKICNRSFIEKSHLVRHERIHLEDKPFKCDNCDYASSRRDKLKEHIQKHHGTGGINKQHRRRYRRAKELLAARAKVSNDFENLFLPISESGFAENSATNLDVSGDNTMIQQQQQQPQTSSEFVLTEMGNVRQNREVSQAQQDAVAQQPQTLPMMSFVPVQNAPNVGGRPSSAVLPHAVVNPVSPSTLSLHNFHFAFSDSPILSSSKDVTLSNALIDSGSLRTPVLAHTSPPHSIGGLEGFESGSNWQDIPRPMSEPSYLMQQQQTDVLGNGGPPWQDASIC